MYISNKTDEYNEFDNCTNNQNEDINIDFQFFTSIKIKQYNNIFYFQFNDRHKD